MKQKLLLSLFALLAAMTAWADVEINETTFPDEIFRNWVLAQSYGQDGILTDEEIAAVKNINVRSKNIQNLTGIGYFTALTKLYCSGNQLTALDVSKNTALIGLYCDNNQLTTLNVSNKTALTELWCDSNQLTSLDVSGCTALSYLKCSSNQLTALDMSQNTELTNLNCYVNQLTALDLSQNTKLTSLSCYQNQIKDEAMDSFVENLPTVRNRSLNVVILDDDENVMTVTQVAAAKAKGWNPLCYACGTWQAYPGIDPDATGEEDVAINVFSFPDANFRNWILKQSYGKDQILTDEEISEVKSIDVKGQSIQTLKGIEYFTALTELLCYDNQLTTLNVSKNTALAKFICYNNQLAELNLSANTELVALNCSDNQLAALDLSASSLLDYLYCGGNQLTELNVSACTELRTIVCDRNNLSSLDISENMLLEKLWCSFNRLRALDLSNNFALKELACFSNRIKGAAMSGLVESLPSVVEGKFIVVYGANDQNVITYEQDDDARAKGWMTWRFGVGIYPYGYSIKGYSVLFSYSMSGYYGSSPNAIDVEINEANFPDVNFRDILLKQEFGVDSLLSVTECPFVTSLDVSGKRIQSLKGIEYFTELTKLYCYNNQLTELDISKNTNLTTLDCYWNQLAELDVSQNTQLSKLYCYENKLTAIDISNNKSLVDFNCYGNQLTALDVSQNKKLTSLGCSSNRLSTLDVSNNTTLTWLNCSNNLLTEFDVSQNTALRILYCSENQLTTLDLSQNTAMAQLYCYQNQIKNEGMDALLERLPTPTTSKCSMYVIVNEDDGNVMTKAQVAAAKTKRWIPYEWAYNQWQEYEGSDPTGIREIDNGQLIMDNEAIYNLAGQRLQKMQKGINIVGGKKVQMK